MAVKEVHAVESIEDAVRMIEGQLVGAMELRINATWYATPTEARRGEHYHAGIRFGESLIVDVHASSPRELAQLALSALVNWRLKLPSPPPRMRNKARPRLQRATRRTIYQRSV